MTETPTDTPASADPTKTPKPNKQPSTGFYKPSGERLTLDEAQRAVARDWIAAWIAAERPKLGRQTTR